MVRNSADQTPGFEPGADHFYTGEHLSDNLNDFRNKWLDEHGYSDFSDDLEHRADFISQIWNYKQWSLQPPFWSWWGEPTQIPPPLRHIPGDVSQEVANDTRLVLPSKQGCNATLSGHVSTGCRTRRRRSRRR